MSRVRVVTVAGDPEREAALAAELMLCRDAELVLRCVDRVEFLAALRGGGLDGAVAVGVPLWLDKQCIDELVRADVRLVGVVDDPLEADRLSSWGASLLTGDASVEDVMTAATSTSSPPAPSIPTESFRPHGRIIAVWGPKGSPGRTSIAVELAAELASSGADTLLIDGDPYGGDILQLLGMVEELPTIVWAAQVSAREELSEAVLAPQLRRAGAAGPIVLPGLPRGELWAEVSQYGWSELLEFARGTFAYTVCDVGFCLDPSESPYPGGADGRNGIARTAVTKADRVVAVCRADPIGIKQFLWAFERLDELTVAEDVVIAMNRCKSLELRELADVIRRHLGRRPTACVPDRPGEFLEAMREGAAVRRVRPGSEVTAAVRSLAAALGGRVAPQGLMAKLSGRR